MIIDITKELFSTPVYPGDPVPSAVQVLGFKKEKPDVCQLTRLSLGSHSGTHLDAPGILFRVVQMWRISVWRNALACVK